MVSINIDKLQGKKLHILLIIVFVPSILQKAYSEDTIYVSQQQHSTDDIVFSGDSNFCADEGRVADVEGIVTEGPLKLDPSSFTLSGPDCDHDGIDSETCKDISGTIKLRYVPEPGTSENSSFHFDENGYWTNCGKDSVIYFSNPVASFDYIVTSIHVVLPDTICLNIDTALHIATIDISAITYPLSGGEVIWSSTDNHITFSDGDKRGTQISSSDTAADNTYEIKFRFTIRGVSFEKDIVAKVCSLTCENESGTQVFGPISVHVNVPPESSSPDAEGYCKYEISDASFDLGLIGIEAKTFPVTKAKVSYRKHCETGEMKDITLSWEGYYAFSLGFIGFAAKSFILTVDVDGHLNGIIELSAFLNEDKNIYDNVILRKGVTGDFTFKYKGINGFEGDFDFNGVKNLNIDIVKQSTILANFNNGTLDSEGKLSGTLNVLPGALYENNDFKVTVEELSVDFSVSINEGFEFINGDGKIIISEIEGTEGTITLELQINSGNFHTVVAASDLTVYSMTLEDLNLTADFNEKFDITKITGYLKAKHDKFDVAIEVSKLEIVDGKLKTFNTSGRVRYEDAFIYEILNSEIIQNKIVFNSKVKLGVTDENAKYEVDGFELDQSGGISITGTLGNFELPLADLAFTAKYKDKRFTGSFTGNIFLLLSMQGSIDIGATPTYEFAYGSFETGTNIPLGESGLEISRLGGKIGLNYILPSTPSFGTYVAGIKLGVSDIAGICEVTNELTVQLSANSAILSLSGNVAVLKDITYFKGHTIVNFRIPENSIDGSISTDIKFPSNGSVIKSENLEIAFKIADGKWNCSGSNMKATIFEVIKLKDGTVNLNGKLSDPAKINGKVSGRAEYSYAYNLLYEKFIDLYYKKELIIKVSGSLKLNMNSNVIIKLNENGLDGSFNVNISYGGKLEYKTIIYSDKFETSGSFNGEILYKNPNYILKGKMDIILPIDYPIKTDINISI